MQAAVLTTDLVMTFKTVSNSVPNEGDTITYAVRIRNLGPDDATGVVVNDLLPGGVTYVSHSTLNGSYDPGSGNWTIGPLAYGGLGVLSITATVDAGTGGSTITNTATITAYDQTDPDLGNNSISVDIFVQAGMATADIGLTKTVDNPTPAEGETVTFTITLTNYGPDTATGIEVYDPMPPGLTLTGQGVTLGGYSSATNIWSIASLGPGGSGTLTLQADPDPGTGGAILTNDAMLTAMNEFDPAPGNNSASADVMVQGPPVAQPDAASTPLGASVVVDVLANDSDPNSNIDPSSVTVTVAPPNGAIEGVNPATGAITYRPNPAFSGNDTFTYQVCDTTLLCATATVTVTVAPGEEVIIDNLDAGAAISGTWITSTDVAQQYASDYLHDDNLDKGAKTVTFTPTLAGGTYQVYLWWTEHTNRATNVPVDVQHASGTATVTVNQQSGGGTWNLLGTWSFNAGGGGSVVIRTGGTNGYVIADAVRFVQVSNP